MSGDQRAFSPTSTSRSSPLYPTATNTTVSQSAMATSAFHPQVSHRFMVPSAPPSSFPSMASLGAALESDSPGPQPIGSPPATDPFSTSSVVIHYLPSNTTEEQLRMMLLFSQEPPEIRMFTSEQGEDVSRSALVRFPSVHAAQNAKEMLDGKPLDDVQLKVEFVPENLANPLRFPTDNTPSSAPGPAPEARRFNNNGYRISSPITGSYGKAEVTSPDSELHYADIFSPQSPIGNHLTERTRQSGKALINNDGAEDDETSELLNNPIRYAENGPTQQRRATAPHIPIGRGLTVNTAPGASSMPSYGHQNMTPQSGHPGIMSPGGLNNASHAMNYQLAGNGPYTRQAFPPANPADQNPPCNTLYVGNLPVDTSEEELKATFSKQRGYKRLCFRTKGNGPMCFVEFEDVSLATRALSELYGHMLHNSVKGGIRLSFSKNPLGVRSGQSPGQAGPGPIGHHNGIVAASSNVFTTASGPPPGLAPPGLSRMPYNGTSPMASGPSTPFPTNGYTNGGGHHWNGYNGPLSAGPTQPPINSLNGIGSNTPNGSVTPNGLNGHHGQNGHNGLNGHHMQNGGFPPGYMGR